LFFDSSQNFERRWIPAFRVEHPERFAIKRQHEPQRIVGDLLNAEINEKQARSIKYQLTIAKLPLAKDLDNFQFEGTPINQTLVNDLAGGGFIDQQRNAVLVGGTGTGTTHLAIAIARSCIRTGARGRFYNVVDLVNRLEIETRNGRQGRIAEHLTRMDFIVLDELGYLPFAQSGGQLLFHLVSRVYERTSGYVGPDPPTAPLVEQAGKATWRGRSIDIG
jgi:DNA replication protein DnaC